MIARLFLAIGIVCVMWIRPAMADDDPTAPIVLPDDEATIPFDAYPITDADRAAVKADNHVGLLPDGDPYWGAALGSTNMADLDKFELDTHKHMSVYSFANAWMSSTGTLNGFNPVPFTAIRNRGTIPMFGWDSWQSCCGANQPKFQLADISNGTYDSYIRSWATAAKAWGHPFFLRFQHEMNGNWYSWSERTNGNSAGQFVTMWRHVHNIFTSVGATNVQWVWCPNISGTTSTPLSELYPGDAYVDWTCLDGYNWAGVKSVPWQTITQVFRGGRVTTHDSYAEVLAVAPDKPMMIGETGSTEKGGSKADWLSSALTTELPNNMPQVKALIYFNRADSGADWPIETSPSATSAFANAVAGGYWEPNVYGTISNIDTLMAGQPAATLTAPNANTATVTLKPTQDTYASSTSQSTTYGGSSEIQTSDSTITAYLDFDLSTLAGHTIQGVTLNLHTSSESWAGSASKFDVHLVQAGWSESTLDWANKPALSPTILGSINQPAKPSTWYSIAINPKSLGNTLNVGLAGSTSDTWAFQSSESANSPTLVVTYS